MYTDARLSEELVALGWGCMLFPSVWKALAVPAASKVGLTVRVGHAFGFQFLSSLMKQ
jgi:hypothetical protein